MRAGYVATIVALALVLAPLGKAHAGYTFVALSYPGAANTWAAGINDSGTIVGYYGDTSNLHGFSLSNGVYTSIDYPGALQTVAYGINNAGIIVGYYLGADGMDHGFSLNGTTYSAINANLPGTYATAAFGINNAGMIVGQYNESSFILSNGVYTAINVPPGRSSVITDALGVNDAGTVIGTYSNGGRNYGFTLSGNTYTTLNYPGSPWTDGNGINNAGTVVGDYTDGSPGTHGFILEGGTYTSLPYPGEAAIIPLGINNANAVVGWGNSLDNEDLNSGIFGFLATPSAVPLPPSVLLLVPGLA
jgi:hypothetical protein